MQRSWYTPTIAALVAVVVLALVAGIGNWSAPAITGGMVAVAILWAVLVAWSDGILPRSAKRHAPR